MKIIDNFLPEDDFKIIQNTFLNDEFPWFLTPFKIQKIKNRNSELNELYNFQFTHNLYSQFSPKSLHIETINSILLRLNPSALIKIKANLTPITNDIVTYGYHTDSESTTSYTGVYYLNSNNGVTLFEDGGTVESVANRMLIFNSALKHSGTSCTDQKVRCVINFNFYTWE
jgi:hypothetical protein